VAREGFIELTMEPVSDVGGPVTNANIERHLPSWEQGLPDPIRHADFDPQRTRTRTVYTLNPNRMHPRIEGDNFAGKQRMLPGVGVPQGSQSAQWDWDTQHVNMRRPAVTSFGNEVDSGAQTDLGA
jgi:hypothetical protein